MKFKQRNLPNGAKLYYVKNKINESTVVKICFDSGSRSNWIHGLAHFTEHMFFTGTKDLSKEEMTKKYFDMGSVNAGTSFGCINFNGQIFTKEFSDYLSTVAKMITESTFSEKDVKKERPVVEQEIAFYKDDYQLISSKIYNYLTFGNEELKIGNLGTKESLATIKSEDVKKFVGKYFVANNMEVSVVSPYPLWKVKRLVTKNLLEKLPVDNSFEKLPLIPFHIANKNFYHIENSVIKKCYIYINFAMDRNRLDLNFKRKFKLVLNMINHTADGMKKALRLKKSLVYTAWMYDDYFEENSLCCFTTECDKENVNEVLKTLAKYLKDVAKKGFTQEQLDKAKRRIEFSRVRKEPKVYQLLEKLGGFKYHGRIIKNKEARKVIKSTTLEEVNELYKEVFENPTVSLLVYGDATKDDVIDKKEFNNIFRTEMQR